MVTTPLGLARLLWWYGEDELFERALSLSAEQVADIGTRAGQLRVDTVEAEAIWPDLPARGYLLIAAIEALEGCSRPAKRSRRRPVKNMPDHLVATEAELWSDPALSEVSRILHERDRRQRREAEAEARTGTPASGFGWSRLRRRLGR